MPDELAPLLADATRAGLYRLPPGRVDALRHAAEALGYGRLETDLGGSPDLAAALCQIGRDLAFPDWYGANLDALADCLGDLSWQEASGYVLLLRNAGTFADLSNLLADVVDEWRQQGVPFWVVFAPGGDDLPPLPDA